MERWHARWHYLFPSYRTLCLALLLRYESMTGRSGSWCVNGCTIQSLHHYHQGSPGSLCMQGFHGIAQLSQICWARWRKNSKPPWAYNQISCVSFQAAFRPIQITVPRCQCCLEPSPGSSATWLFIYILKRCVRIKQWFTCNIIHCSKKTFPIQKIYIFPVLTMEQRLVIPLFWINRCVFIHDLFIHAEHYKNNVKTQ